jgi:hypothetical protein
MNALGALCSLGFCDRLTGAVPTAPTADRQVMGCTNPTKIRVTACTLRTKDLTDRLEAEIRDREAVMDYEDRRIDCPRCGEWVPIAKDTVTATCPYCMRLVPVGARRPEAFRDRLLRAADINLTGKGRARRVVTRRLLAGRLDRRLRGLLAEPGMGSTRNLLLVVSGDKG